MILSFVKVTVTEVKVPRVKEAAERKEKHMRSKMDPHSVLNLKSIRAESPSKTSSLLPNL